MSKYYNPQRTSRLFGKDFREAFPLSRTKIDLFLNCPRCFYLDRKMGVGQPPGYPFALNSAVDRLLKKEFDTHRAKQKTHPLMKAYGIDAVPLEHPEMDHWRDALRGGIQYLDPETSFLVTGAIDDVWANSEGEIYIVDYKATAKDKEVDLDQDWQIGYKRQMEIYQWLFRKNGFQVSNTGYFVYANGQTDREAFDGKLEFDVKIIPYEGDDGWVHEAIRGAYGCLSSEALPSPGKDCDFCRYREAAGRAIEELMA